MKYKEEATTLKESIHNSSGGNDQPKGTFVHVPFMLQLLPWNKQRLFQTYIHHVLCNFTVLSDNPIYECLSPFRCLLIKNICPNNWNVMQKMEQHTNVSLRWSYINLIWYFLFDKKSSAISWCWLNSIGFQLRKEEPFYNINQTNTVKFLRHNVFKIKDENVLPDSSSSDELQGTFRMPIKIIVFLSIYIYIAVI